MKEFYLNTKDIADWKDSVKVGDKIYLSGTVYTARDAAHKRIIELLDNNQKLPFELKNSIIYYCGPTPTPDNFAIGSCGPTTSCRMDAYSPVLIALGQTGMIGKGSRSREVVEAMKQHKAVYFGAIGGCGALLAKCIKKCEVVAYEDLGPEAVHRLEVEDFPVTVVIDSLGNDLYETGRQAWLERKKQNGLR